MKVERLHGSISPGASMPLASLPSHFYSCSEWTPVHLCPSHFQYMLKSGQVLILNVVSGDMFKKFGSCPQLGHPKWMTSMMSENK